MDGPVLGVFKNFHFKSLHDEIQPLIIMVYPRFKFSVQIRIATDNLQSTIAQVKIKMEVIKPQYSL